MIKKISRRIPQKIRVDEYLKGHLDLKELKATGVHLGRGLPRTYKVGKEYTFAVDLKDKAGNYEVILPADGCPELPRK